MKTRDWSRKANRTLFDPLLVLYDGAVRPLGLLSIWGIPVL